MKNLYLAAALLAAFTLASCNSTPEENTTATATAQTENTKTADATFFRESIGTNLFLIEAGRHAQLNGSNERVKRLGQQLAHDHNQSLEELHKLMTAQGHDLPAQMSDDQRKHLEVLKQHQGPELDQEFITRVHEVLDKETELYRDASTAASEVKAHAAKWLPTLESNQATARKLEGRLKVPA